MKIRRLVFLFSISLFTVLLLTGCAHRKGNYSQTIHKDKEDTQMRNNTTDEALRTSSIPEIPDSTTDKTDTASLKEDRQEEKKYVSDPLSPFNRAMFHFNDKLYFWALKPLAKGYKVVAPDFVRTSFKNFFNNLQTPKRLVNCMLQAKGKAASVEVSRFAVNSTIGVLGFGRPADNYSKLAAPDPEDLGQTLASYGLGNGVYLVWPILGPSTLRDSIGSAGDSFLDPIRYVEPSTGYIIRGVDLINGTSFRIGDYEKLKKTSKDPYSTLRNIYLENRKKKIDK